MPSTGEATPMQPVADATNNTARTVASHFSDIENPLSPAETRRSGAALLPRDVAAPSPTIADVGRISLLLVLLLLAPGSAAAASDCTPDCSLREAADALEVAMVLEKRYGVVMSEDSE